MRNLKKVLTLVLTVAMLLSIMVVGTGAAFSDQDSIKNKEAVDVCTTLNIIAGMEDGSYRPANNVTRAQMCKMICVALNGGKEPTLGTNATPTFSDVRTDPSSSWAESFIESCNSQGIVSGVGGGRFSPSGNVTGTQAARMLLVALGYRADQQGFTGSGWEINVNTLASSKGLYAGLEGIDANAALSRDNAAQMIWNALNAYEVEYVSQLVTVDGTLTSKLVAQDKVVGSNKDKITLLKDKYEVFDNESGIMIGFTYEENKGEWTYTFGGANENLTIKNNKVTTTADYTDLFMQNVKVLYTQQGNLEDDVDGKVVDKVYGMYVDGSSVVASGVLDDIETMASDSAKIKVDGTEYKLSDVRANIGLQNFNQYSASPTYDLDDVVPTLQNQNAKAYNFELIDNDDDNRGDVVVVHPFTVSQINYLSSSKITLTDGIGSKDLADINIYSGAAEDDWTIVTAAANAKDETLTVEKAEILSGEVSAIRGTEANPTSIQVGGTWYSMAAATCDGSDTPRVGNSYDLVVMNGYVFNAEKTKGTISADNVLFLEKLGALTSGLADGVEAKVYFSDGSNRIITINTVTAPDTTTLPAIPGATTADDVAAKSVNQGDSYDIVQSKSPATDEINNLTAAALLDDYMLYTYSEKNGEYTVEPITANNIGGYDKYVATGSATKVEDGKIASTTEGTARFDADAVIFVKDSNGVKVVTGATVNGWKETPITGFAALSSKSNGNLYTAIGAITMTGTAKSDAFAYGFITSDISQEKVDTTWYYSFEMWNGTENVKVMVDRSTSNTPVKYGFVKFDWEDQSEGKADKDAFDVKTASADATSITSWVEKDSISFNGAPEIEFADEYFVIGVDTNNGVGAEVRGLATAKDCQKKHTGETVATAAKYANAVYFTVLDGSKTVVEAVFIDVDGAMHDGKNGPELCKCVITP